LPEPLDPPGAPAATAATAAAPLTDALATALAAVDTWPVPDAAAAALVLHPGAEPVVVSHGDAHRRYRLASISKPMAAWAALVAVEEGVVGLDDAVGQPGCTLRHLLAHAGGYPFDGAEPISAPGRRRIYSNTGIELAAAHVEAATGFAFAEYLAQAVFEPLGMSASELRGSPAHQVWSTLNDTTRFARELAAPTLVGAAIAAAATNPVFPGLRGVVPGVGSYPDCVWGLGVEIRGDKAPHWTGSHNSARAFGHFGGSGTLLWVDPGAVASSTVACVALTDRPFDEWSAEALRRWPELGDRVLAAAGTADPRTAPGAG
jgi:CubicO group peptidase (beta-lactamase class C family)